MTALTSRAYSSASAATAATRTAATTLKRSWLYVPASNERMLAKSLVSPSDSLIYDLEDSVAPSSKEGARETLVKFLKSDNHPAADRVSVRVNALETQFFASDMDTIIRHTSVQTVVLPKIHSPSDLAEIAKRVPDGRKLNVVASIESVRALWSVGEIAAWKSPDIQIIALLFASEDYCADTGIIRTRDRSELLYTRSRIVSAAKAFGLQAIDMVCVDYKDQAYLKNECEDGRRLGYDGKQAIHPTQVETIQATFVPTQKEISRAAQILIQMDRARTTESRGAFGLQMEGGEMEMIDEPMLKQAIKIIAKAKAAGLSLPDGLDDSLLE